MILVLLLNWVFIRHPYLPISPGTLGRGLFYICDSRMTEVEASHLGLQGSEDYYLGQMIGISGCKRIGIDFVEDHGRA